MSSRNLKADSFAISNELVLSLKSSRLKYEQLKQLNRDQDKLGMKNDQLEILNSEIKDINAKMEQLVKINQQLDNEFETFVFEAERLPQNAHILLSKATAMKRKCKENKEDIKKLEGAIKVLEVLETEVGVKRVEFILINFVSVLFKEYFIHLYIFR